MLKNLDYCLSYNLDSEYDHGNSDDDSNIDSHDDYDYIKIFKLISSLNKYNQHKKYENKRKRI